MKKGALGVCCILLIGFVSLQIVRWKNRVWLPTEPGTTIKLTRSWYGGDANDVSGYPRFSADGRFVVFHSRASNLVLGDTNDNYDIFLYDSLKGTIKLISRGSIWQQGNGYSMNPDISGNGRYIVFNSYASNLVANDTNDKTSDIFLYDRETDVMEMISVNDAGEQGDDFSMYPAISDDGRYVSYMSCARNLVPDKQGHCYHGPYARSARNDWRIYVYDRQTHSVEIVLIGTGAGIGSHNPFPTTISGSGCCVAATINHEISSNIYSYNLITGQVRNEWGVGSPDFSADGQHLVYTTRAAENIAGDYKSGWALYEHTGHLGYGVWLNDRAAETAALVSLNAKSEKPDGDSGGSVIADNGRYVAFISEATNLVPDDDNGQIDVFIRDLQMGKTVRVNIDPERIMINGEIMTLWEYSTYDLSITADGEYVAFVLTDANLILGKKNGIADIFIHMPQWTTDE